MKHVHPSRGTWQRVALSVVVLSLALLLLACATAELASDLNESEAQEIVVVLQQYGLSPKKVKIGEGKEATFTVVVPTSQSGSANQILKKFELPRQTPKGLGEVFSEGGLIPTATEEKAKLLMALQGEIAHTLETVDGIASARVHIVLPERDPLAETQQSKPSASVFIKYRGEHLPLTVEEIKQIVAHSVDGLDTSEVAVVMKPILIDRSRLAAMTKGPGGVLGIQETMIIIIALAAVCLILVILVIVMVVKLQGEKKRYMQLRMSVAGSARS
jgi:type III secretion protein J